MSLKIIMEKLLDWPESKFKTNGVKINYRIFGNGSPIILLHGYPQNSLIWHKIVSPLSKMILYMHIAIIVIKNEINACIIVIL